MFLENFKKIYTKPINSTWFPPRKNALAEFLVNFRNRKLTIPKQ